MVLIVADSHTELSRKGPQKITLNRKRLCLIWPYFFEVLVSDLVLFIWGGGFRGGGLRVVNICIYVYMYYTQKNSQSIMTSKPKEYSSKILSVPGHSRAVPLVQGLAQTGLAASHALRSGRVEVKPNKRLHAICTCAGSSRA